MSSAPKAAITQQLLGSLNESQRKQLLAMIHLVDVQEKKKIEAEAAAAAAAKAAAFAAAAAHTAAEEEEQAREEIPDTLEIPLPVVGFKASSGSFPVVNQFNHLGLRYLAGLRLDSKGSTT